jgi:hypothetical protein
VLGRIRQSGGRRGGSSHGFGKCGSRSFPVRGRADDSSARAVVGESSRLPISNWRRHLFTGGGATVAALLRDARKLKVDGFRPSESSKGPSGVRLCALCRTYHAPCQRRVLSELGPFSDLGGSSTCDHFIWQLSGLGTPPLFFFFFGLEV